MSAVIVVLLVAADFVLGMFVGIVLSIVDDKLD